MSTEGSGRGGTPVGYVTDLDPVEAASVMYLRMWCDGPEAQARVWNDLASELGHQRGRKVLKAFEQLCNLCARHGRRPLMRHAVKCKCMGSDEACFANFVATATAGEREDAMLIATLLVRADIAPLITALAADFGMGLKQMSQIAPHGLPSSTQRPVVLH